MLSDKTLIRREQHIAWQDMDDKVVVVTPRTRRIHILYGTGSRIWAYLQEPRTLAAVIGLLCDEYEVGPQDAARDVQAFLQDLSEKEIVLLNENS